MLIKRRASLLSRCHSKWLSFDLLFSCQTCSPFVLNLLAGKRLVSVAALLSHKSLLSPICIPVTGLLVQKVYWRGNTMKYLICNVKRGSYTEGHWNRLTFISKNLTVFVIIFQKALTPILIYWLVYKNSLYSGGFQKMGILSDKKILHFEGQDTQSSNPVDTNIAYADV